MAGEFIPFRFEVTLVNPASSGNGVLARAAFTEVSGLEAAMTVKSLKEGGRNWGEVQLAGSVTFQPLVLKRGVTEVGDLWAVLEAVGYGANTALRLEGRIDVYPEDRKEESTPALRYRISRALPTKYKGAELSSTAGNVAIEELHLAHEGLRVQHAPGATQ